MGTKGLARITAQLIQHGRAPETPVALIRWGTTSEQYTLIGTLADIADKAAAVNLEPPAVTIVGEVVNLAERLQWFLPLAPPLPPLQPAIVSHTETPDSDVLSL